MNEIRENCSYVVFYSVIENSIFDLQALENYTFLLFSTEWGKPIFCLYIDLEARMETDFGTSGILSRRQAAKFLGICLTTLDRLDMPRTKIRRRVMYAVTARSF